MLNKKGYSLVELMATVAILGILSGIAVMAISAYTEKTRKKVYENFEKQMKDATVNYYTYHLGDIPTSGTATVQTTTLVNESFLDEMVDPADNSKKCSGKVIVKNNSNTTSGDINNNNSYNYDANGNIITSNTKNIDLSYTVCLKCSKYETANAACN